MPKKLKVLISAYACEPNKGSEPEVGWQWAMQMCRYHDVTVLTRTHNRPAIERELAKLSDRQPAPQFIYHDERPALLWFKRRFNALLFYYVLWQSSAWRLIDRLVAEQDFDILHHVTFAGFRYRTAIWHHGVPSVWGPVGGIDSLPWRLLPWKHFASLFPEMLRNLNNILQSAPFNLLLRRARSTTVTVVSTEEMKEKFHRLGLEVIVMPTIGLQIQPMPPRMIKPAPEPLKFLFVGSIITLKGVDLAIEAFKAAGVNATFTIVGSGKFGEAARLLVRRLGMERQVIFRGRLPREETLKIYAEYDVFLFPSLHDTGSYAVIEAMASGMPVICLDCGGPRVAVKNGSGMRIALGTRRKVIADLAAAIRDYDVHREWLAEHGAAAREVILQEYDWDKKGRQLNAVYAQAAGEKKAGS